MSTELSLSRDRSLVVKIPAAENATRCAKNKQVAIDIASQEWKKAVATCSIVAGRLRSVTVSVN